MLNIIINRGVKDIEDENYVFSPDTYLNITMRMRGLRMSW